MLESTKTNVQTFNSAQFGELRTQLGPDGRVWFCLNDVMKSLGLSNVTKLKSRLNERGCTISAVGVQTGVKKDETPSIQVVKMLFIDEPNLYRCVFQSRKAEAEKFQDWVFEEVLPTIRRTGGYGAGQASDRDVIRAAARIAGGQASLSRFLGIGESTISEVVNGCGRPSGDMVRFVVETCRRIVALGATDGVQVCRPESICRLPRYRMRNRLTPNRMIHLLTLAHRIEDERLRLELVRELTEGGAR